MPRSLQYGLLSLVLCAPICLALFRTPVPWNDMMLEIIVVEQKDVVTFFEDYFTGSLFYFRPFELFLRYTVKWFAGHSPLGYAAMGALFTFLTCWVMLQALAPKNRREFGLAALAISVLLGHHAFYGSLEYNIVISNLFTMLLAALLLWWLQARNRCPSALVLIAVVLGLATKELGLVLVWLVVGPWVLGVGAVRRPVGWGCLLLGGLYVGYKVVSMLNSDIDAYGDGREGGLAFYATNFAATPLNILLGFPKEGLFETFPLPAESGPWALMHLLSGSLVCLCILAAAFVGKADRARRRYRRQLVIFAGVLLLSSALSFYYTRDRHGAMALPMFVYLFYVGAQRLLAHPWPRPAAQGVLLVALLALSLSWGLRSVGHAYYLRDLSHRVRINWLEVDPVAMGAEYEAEPAGQAIIERYRDHALQVPAPLLWRDHPAWSKTLGGLDSLGK